MAPTKDKRAIKFVITETDRHTKGFTIYKVTSMICSKSTPDVVSKVSIWKRYSDFKKLHVAMKPLYSSLRIKEPYPSFPRPKFFGRFETEVIEERRHCALNFLEFVARHPSLFTSDVFVQFFETSELGKNKLDSTVSLSSESSEDDRNTVEECTNFKLKSNTNIESNNCIGNSEIDSVDKTVNDLSAPRITLHDGSDLPNSKESTAQYILIAAAHMSAAFRHEAIAEYEEAFTQYKLGISHLLNGVQTDPDSGRKVLIQEKISKYLQRAEKLYNRHLNCNVSVLNKPVSELKNYKVIKVMGSMMLVKDILRGSTRIIKTVEKEVGSLEDANMYILRGKVPYMVQLYGCIQTDTTVFLILQYISTGRLWDFVEANYKTNKTNKKGHIRSSSCDAVMQVMSQNSSYLNQSLVEYPKFPSQTYILSNNTNSDGHAGATNIPETITASAEGDLPTNQLLENAQKLLQSVNATLKRSNSIASRMNESETLLYDYQKDQNNETTIQDIPTIKIDEHSDKKDKVEIDCLNQAKEDGNLSESSFSDSFTDLSSIKDKIDLNSYDVENDNDNSLMCDSISSETKVPFGQNVLNELCVWDSVIVDTEPAIWNVPETVVQKWAGEIICTLEALHQQDVVVGDLRPENLLIAEDGHVAMTYIVRGHRSEITSTPSVYVAPELRMFIHPIDLTPAADVWSFGVLLYELLTGFRFHQKHLGEFHSYSIVNIPDYLSESAKSLLYSILKYSPSDRLTIPEIKQHPFFTDIDWLNLLNY